MQADQGSFDGWCNLQAALAKASFTLLTSLLLIGFTSWLNAAELVQTKDTDERILAAVNQIGSDSNEADSDIKIIGCNNYPYHQNTSLDEGEANLINDLKAGLAKGLRCLAGQGPQGALHPYHLYQGLKLLRLIENGQTKTFKCVEDQVFAYSVAKGPRGQDTGNSMQDILGPLPPYSVILDTYRIGGFISNKHSEDDYRNFFKLKDNQITELLTGTPLRLKGVHRYQDLPALLFHEMVHWLGHTHSNMYPDVTHLYTTCCFGGSDYIEDEAVNEGFQQQACNILKDDELWSANKYQQMRQWRYKGYDQLKREMRGQYN